MTPKSLLIVALLIPGTVLACPGGEDAASKPFSAQIHRVKNHVTPTGRTIGQVVLATVPRPSTSENKKLVYGSPEWSGAEHGDGVMVSVTQSPIGGKGEDGVITHRWLVKGKKVWSVPPNDIDSSLPAWTDDAKP